MDEYAEGRMAYLAGKTAADNPYESHTREHRQWRAGFHDEMQADTPADPYESKAT